eukprot:3223344-Prymnesium_polylepis.1
MAGHVNALASHCFCSCTYGDDSQLQQCWPWQARSMTGMRLPFRHGARESHAHRGRETSSWHAHRSPAGDPLYPLSCQAGEEPAIRRRGITRRECYGAHRRVYRDALTAGVFRHEWQCSTGAQGLVDALSSAVDALAFEAYNILVNRRVPHGFPADKFILNAEHDLTNSGQWLQMHLWDNGRQQRVADATPRLRDALRPFASMFHASGH